MAVRAMRRSLGAARPSNGVIPILGLGVDIVFYSISFQHVYSQPQLLCLFGTLHISLKHRVVLPQYSFYGRRTCSTAITNVQFSGAYGPLYGIHQSAQRFEDGSDVARRLEKEQVDFNRSRTDA